jgi:hypothetical protein
MKDRPPGLQPFYFINQVQAQVNEIYGPTVFFEPGP